MVNPCPLCGGDGTCHPLLVELTPEWYDTHTTFKAFPRRSRPTWRDRFADALAWLSRLLGGQ